MADTFMGITIEGDICSGRSYTNQRTHEELVEYIQPLVDDPAIASISWHQYTPYFNDGDVCEFSAYGASVRTIWDSADADTYDLEVSEYHPTLGCLELVKDSEPTVHEYANGRSWTHWGHHDETRDNPNYSADRLAAAVRLNEALESGSFDAVLNELFGDHAEVIVTRDGITVEFYDHD